MFLLTFRFQIEAEMDFWHKAQSFIQSIAANSLIRPNIFLIGFHALPHFSKRI